MFLYVYDLIKTRCNLKFSNIVRVKIKQEEYENVIAIIGKPLGADGLLQEFVVQTGKNIISYIGIWESEQHIIDARPLMISRLDQLRDKLEILSENLGVTDPASGPIIFEF